MGRNVESREKDVDEKDECWLALGGRRNEAGFWEAEEEEDEREGEGGEESGWK